MSTTFHLKNPAMQDSYRIFNQDCELVSQLPKVVFADLAHETGIHSIVRSIVEVLLVYLHMETKSQFSEPINV